MDEAHNKLPFEARQIHVLVDTAVLAKIKRLAADQGMPSAEVIRKALYAYTRHI